MSEFVVSIYSALRKTVGNTSTSRRDELIYQFRVHMVVTNKHRWTLQLALCNVIISIYVIICVYLSIYLSVCLSVYLSIYLYMCVAYSILPQLGPFWGCFAAQVHCSNSPHPWFHAAWSPWHPSACTSWWPQWVHRENRRPEVLTPTQPRSWDAVHAEWRWS